MNKLRRRYAAKKTFVSVSAKTFVTLSRRAEELGVTRVTLLDAALTGVTAEPSLPLRREYSVHVSSSTHERLARRAEELGVTMKSIVECALFPDDGQLVKLAPNTTRNGKIYISDETHDLITQNAAALGVTRIAFVRRVLAPVEKAVIDGIFQLGGR